MAFIHTFIIVCIEFRLLVMALRPVVQSSMDLCNQSVYFTEVVKCLTAVAAAQTIATDTSSSVACGPCSILDMKRRACFSANDIPQDVMKINSFKIEMMHG